MSYTEDTQIFVMAMQKSFVCLADISAAKQWALAFTSQSKAKEFLRKFPKKADRVLPCTLGEWFGWQDSKGWPNLTIDLDLEALLNYPLHLNIDTSKHDIFCVTREHVGMKSYEVIVQKREDRQI